jgi:hypothetical protein
VEWNTKDNGDVPFGSELARASRKRAQPWSILMRHRLADKTAGTKELTATAAALTVRFPRHAAMLQEKEDE